MTTSNPHLQIPYQKIKEVDLNGRNSGEDGASLSEVEMRNQKFSVFVAICFTVNYVMGTGFLTMPWAFAQTGILPGLVCLFLIGCCAVVSKDYILETMARAEISSQGGLDSPNIKIIREQMPSFQKNQQNQNDDRGQRLSQGQGPNGEFPPRRERGGSEGNWSVSNVSNVSNEVAVGDEEVPLIEQEGGGGGGGQRGRTTRPPTNSNNLFSYSSPLSEGNVEPEDRRYPYASIILVQNKKFEIPSLCQKYLGSTGRISYCFFLGMYIYGTLWVYTSVFAQAFSEVIPLFKDHEDYNYYFYVAAFALIVIPLTCKELTEQIHVQVTMSTCRFLMVFLMVATTLPVFWDKDSSEPVFGEQTSPAGFQETFSSKEGWKKLYLMIPIATYAFIYHHSLPGLSHPVRDKEKLGFIFNMTFLLCFCLYSLLCITVAAYFGKEYMNPSSNLNWSNYNGLRWAKWLQVLVSKFILLFPALDVVSAAPLNGITLGNNLLVAFYGEGALSEGREMEKQKLLFFRLVASIPPIIGALIVQNLGHLTDYTGIAGMIITFVFPSLLQWYSRKALQKELETRSGRTSYATYLTRKRFIPVIGLAGVFLALYSFIYNIKESM